MPTLFALGQHMALDAIQRNLRQDEKVFAFHVDLYVVGQDLQTSDVHAVLLSRISAVPDLQCAWLILLFCASARANYLLRVVHPADERQSKHFSVQRGLGIRSATRDMDSAFWGSWADALPTIRESPSLSRGPVLRRTPTVRWRVPHERSSFLPKAIDGARFRLSRMGRRCQRTATGSGFCSRGAAQHIEEQFRTDSVMSQLELHEQALFRSQSGPLAGGPLHLHPEISGDQIRTSALPCVASQTPLVSFTPMCRCARPLDPCGHHRAACPHAGFWDEGGSHWRAQQDVCAERPENASRPMCVCRKWTSLREVTRTIAASRWWQIGCRCSMAPSLPSTPRLSPR